MKVGKRETVHVRMTQKVIDGIQEGIEGTGTVVVEEINVAPLMGARLEGHDFRIALVGGAEERIVDEDTPAN